MSKILRTVFASAPTDDIPWFTLELSSDAWLAPVRFVQSKEPGVESFGIEGGVSADFICAPINVSPPARTIRGNQDLQFQIDNVSGEALTLIDQAIESGEKIYATLRTYIESNRSAPSDNPVKLTGVSTRINITSVSMSASFHDLVNKSWPALRFTPEFAPGLIYQ